MIKPMPTIDEVLKYGKNQLDIYIHKNASTLPEEQKEEIKQEGLLRILEAYERLDPELGWKSFIQLHSMGAVLDYIRSSSGFSESEITEKDRETGEVAEEKKPWRLRRRVTTTSRHDDIMVSIDHILGSNGHYEVHELFKSARPRWELISRMASQDIDIHLVGKLLLGFTQSELSEMFRVSRERLTQRFQEFCERLDSPCHIGSRWVAQTIFAFGLCAEFGMPDKDLKFGWEYESVDLLSTEVNYIDKVNPQMAFNFNWEQMDG